MLSSLRKFSETIIAKIFILLIALSFVFWGINDFLGSSRNSSVAEIDGEKISFNQFLIEFNKIMLNNNIESAKKAIDKNIHLTAISNIVSEKLLKMHSKNKGVYVDETTIATEIKNTVQFKDGASFSRLKYEKFLLERNINSKILEEQIKKNIMRNVISESIIGYIPSNKTYAENLIKNKINLLYEDYLTKKYKIEINEKSLNNFLKNI
jgi:peptidyl-prolyl cis-trans isomerase D